MNRLATFGWLLFAFSYLLERHVAFGFDMHGDFLLVPTVALMLMVAFLQTKLLPTAMMHRRVTNTRHVNYSLLLIAGYIALGILAFMLDSNPTRALAPLGGEYEKDTRRINK
jgi:hypothetical protein